MPDLLIRNLDPDLMRRLFERARGNRRSTSEEAAILLQQALAPSDKRGLGTAMAQLIPNEYRGDDLVFEVPGEVSRPPEFE